MTDPTAWISKPRGNGRVDTAAVKRHKVARAQDGFSEYDWWNFNDYLSWVIIQGLEKFKTGSGTPSSLESRDEWVKILDTMIEGFKAQQEISSMDSYDSSTMTYMEWYAPLIAKWERGGALFVKYYGSLWD